MSKRNKGLNLEVMLKIKDAKPGGIMVKITIITNKHTARNRSKNKIKIKLIQALKNNQLNKLKKSINQETFSLKISPNKVIKALHQKKFGMNYRMIKVIRRSQNPKKKENKLKKKHKIKKKKANNSLGFSIN